MTPCGLVTPCTDTYLVNLGSGNGLLPDTNKSLAEPMLIFINRVLCHSNSTGRAKYINSSYKFNNTRWKFPWCNDLMCFQTIMFLYQQICNQQTTNTCSRNDIACSAIMINYQLYHWKQPSVKFELKYQKASLNVVCKMSTILFYPQWTTYASESSLPFAVVIFTSTNPLLVRHETKL